MTDWFSGTVQANGVRLFYYRTGGDKPPLVLAHGFTDNGLCWRRLALALQTDYDMVMYDARGHGLSESPHTGYSADLHAADLAGLIDALGLEQPIVMGHSMGANTAANTAARYPDLVRAAILEDPPWFLPTEKPLAEPEEGPEEDDQPDPWFLQLQQFKTQTREALMASCHENNPRWHDLDLGDWADSKLQFDLDVFHATRRPLDLIWWQETVRLIRVPVLLLTGDPEQGALVTPAAAQQALELGQQVQVARIEQAGHSLRRDQFEAYLTAVKAFLADHPAH